MRLLLDTHALLWWALDHPNLSAPAREAIGDPNNEVRVSAATAWELAIKIGIGRLRLPIDLDVLLAEELRANGFVSLPVTTAHAVRVLALPQHHRDPFDRMLIAQALAEGLTLVSADEVVHAYAVPVLW